ncbi:DUF5010 domain-containing protein [Hufsiella ginkgonis]|uniref:DUF5010 domain-containing protein n=1 Tax=Hufsiella ginkgonis TaxID=2695274 RepID=A0A7K1XTB8_9SPHI|nr:DUF5010 domain-containing protein [Hufsiella ginkgonis]MXV14057.1 DUF5010 domain-containing protein [Hufsiella ginkgonis]
MKRMTNRARAFAVPLKSACFYGLTALTLFSCSKEPANDAVTQQVNSNPKQAASISAATQFIGSVVGFNGTVRSGGGPNPTPAGNTLYNLPLYKSSAVENDWWDNLVEEFAYSGQDFFAANCRGYSPNVPTVDHGDPRKLALLCQAMDRRGVTGKFTIAVFDDCPSSWAANRNVDNGAGYQPTNPKFDCGNTANYKYIWDLNIKTAFQNIPDAKRFKYNGRPVVFFWGVSTNWADNYGNSNLKKILQYIRTQFNAAFGQNPYLVVDKSWIDRDPTVNDPAVTDAVHAWFDMAHPWTMRTFNGVNVGSGVAGFRVVQGTTNMFIDANHGQTFLTTLNNTRGAGAALTLLEGFTDVAENAAIFRSSDVTYYDYPNQRINIVRRYSNDPYPATLKVEAEGCDSFNDVTAGNSGNMYRDGDIDVVKTGDANGGWHVTGAQANEWLEWRELPFKSGNSKFQVRYSSNQAASVRFNVDGVDLPVISLPVTGNGVYSTIDAGTKSFTSNSLHTVRLKIVSGSLAINYFNRVSI